jgi:antitoxin component YwqK of YwqJK toxin-antitoxin module
MSSGNYRDGKLHGLRETFHQSNGQLESSQNFIDGAGDGLWEFFDMYGNLIRTVTYRNGEEVEEVRPEGSGVHEEFHRNGQLSIRGNLIGGERDGLWEEFDDNGQLKVRENYVGGERDGLRENFDINGTGRYLRRTYSDGELDGLWEDFTGSGQLTEIRSYIDGKPDGLWATFAGPNMLGDGSFLSRRTFRNGVNVWGHEIYDRQGRLEDIRFEGRSIFEQRYGEPRAPSGELVDRGGNILVEWNGPLAGAACCGEVIMREFYVDGQLKSRRNYWRGYPRGLWEEFDQNGNLTKSRMFRNTRQPGGGGSSVEIRPDGTEDGLWEAFYDNGQLKVRENYVGGERNGLREEFHPNGQLKFRRTYSDGELDGLWEDYHENDQWEESHLKERRNYVDGELDGLHEIFHENGQLSERGNFIDGKQDGLFEFFDENGNLTNTVTYRNGERN